MARIRTIKPEFFKHDGLFDAEVETGFPLRVAFAGLWTCCDREGRFSWRPRQLKTDVLPYDEVDFSRVLDALAARGFIVKYVCAGEAFGFIPSWHRHQIINNRETPSSIPSPDSGGIVNPNEIDASSARERRVLDAFRTPLSNYQGEGKGKEGERKGRERLSSDADASMCENLDLVGGGYAANGRSRKPEKRDELESDFIAWWLAYPRREAKGQARKAYAAARKKVSAETLLKAAQHAAKLYAATELRFIPLPATWLNGERWLDETAARDPPANAYTTGRSI